MPVEDYTPVTRGGLKLKGGAPMGVKKKKKKEKRQEKEEPSGSRRREAMEKAIGDEERDDDRTPGKEMAMNAEEEVGHLSDGQGQDEVVSKTESERAAEELRKKRVSLAPAFRSGCFPGDFSRRWGGILLIAYV